MPSRPDAYDHKCPFTYPTISHSRLPGRPARFSAPAAQHTYFKQAHNSCASVTATRTRWLQHSSQWILHSSLTSVSHILAAVINSPYCSCKRVSNQLLSTASTKKCATLLTHATPAHRKAIAPHHTSQERHTWLPPVMTTVFPVVFGRDDALYIVSRGGALGALVVTAQVRMPHRSALACA